MADNNTCANPLLLGWLEEWMDEAQQRNSKAYLIYKKAHASMKACPLPFNHPNDAQRLSGLGPKLCARLTDKLKAHCEKNGLPMPEKHPVRNTRPSDGEDTAAEPAPKKTRKTAPYVPKLRSGPYALIMALGTLDEEGSQMLTKAELIDKAQPFCDASFSVPKDPTNFYTAWQSMVTLQTKELVCTQGHPTKRYCLTDDGWEVARRMKQAEQGKAVGKSKKPARIANNEPVAEVPSHAQLDGIDDIAELSGCNAGTGLAQEGSLPDLPALADGSAGSHAQSHEQAPPIVLQPGTFEVKLLVDTREVRTKRDREYIVNELKKLGIDCETRALPLGDILWTAKLNPPHDSAFRLQNAGDDGIGSNELVLEHVIERKRMDDLVSSIKDGRYEEQKFRLEKSGMKNVTYVIEDYTMSAEKTDRFEASIDTTIARMQTINDIFVKQTARIDETIRYIALMTKELKSMYEARRLHVIPTRTLDVSRYLDDLKLLRSNEPDNIFCTTFSAFCALCDKSESLTLRDQYLKLLMCTSGITGDKAIEIQKIWPTPIALIEAYERCGHQAAKDNMISDRLGSLIPRKKIAIKLSKSVAEVWGT